MSHMFDSGVFVGKPAWHGLGEVVQEAPSTAEAMKIAKMDWKVEETSLEDAGCPGWKRLNRSDNNELLHVCRDSWTVVQNSEAFSWFDPFIQDGDVELEAAISLGSGKRISILAKIKDSSMEVVPSDAVEPYLLLYNSHDGTLALGVKFTNIRVVCQNTLSMATRNEHSRFDGDMTWNGKSARLRHAANISANLEAVRDAIDVQRRAFRYTIEEYKAMAQKDMNVDLFRAYLETVFDSEMKQKQRSKSFEGKVVTVNDLIAYNNLMTNFESGVGQDIPGVAGTVWAGYQAVSEYFTHQRGRSDSARLDYQWFGEGQKTLYKAHDTALAFTRS